MEKDKKFKDYPPSFIIGDDKKELKMTAWADNLPDTDWFGKIQPFYKIKYGDRELFTSNHEMSGDIPVWKDANIQVPANAKKVQIEVYDKDMGSDDLLGKCEVPIPSGLFGLRDVTEFADGVFDLLDDKEKKTGHFIVGKAEKPALIFCSAENLHKTDLWGGSDPYFKVLTADEERRQLYKSEPQKSCLNPVWPEAEFRTPVKTKKLKIEVWDWDPAGDDKMGECVVDYPFENGFHKINEKGGGFIIGDERMEIKIDVWADDLKKSDLFGGNDPYFKLMYGDQVLYKSELNKNNKGKTPIWQTATVEVPKHVTSLGFEVFDKDTAKDDSIGVVLNVEVKDGKMVEGNHQLIKKPEKPAKKDSKADTENDKNKKTEKSDEKLGTLYIGKAEEPCKLLAWGNKLASADGKTSDPLFEIYAGDRFLHRSETCSKTTTPIWKEQAFFVPKGTTKLTVIIKDHDILSANDTLGETVIPYPLEDGRYDMFQEKEGMFIIGREMKEIKQLPCWADNLEDTELFGSIDPYYVVKYGDWELYRSEVSKNSVGGENQKNKAQTPVWKPADFEIPAGIEFLEIKVFDKDSGNDDFLGSCQIPVENNDFGFEMVEVEVEKSKKDETKPVSPAQTEKQYTLTSYEIGEKGAMFCIGAATKPTTLFVSAEGLPKADFFGLSDPFFQVWDVSEEPRKLHESEAIKKTFTPVWKKAEIHVPVNVEEVLIKILDKDFVGTVDADLLGQVRVKFPFEPKEYILEDKDGMQSDAKIVLGNERYDIDLEAWADNLAIADGDKPYYKVIFGDRVIAESKASKGKRPVWDKIQLSIPQHYTSFDIQIFDKDTFSRDDLVAECTIPIVPKPTEKEALDAWFAVELKAYELGEGKGSFVVGPPTEPTKLDAWAEGLSCMDGKSSDPYYTITTPGCNSPHVESMVIKKNTTPVWGESNEFYMPLNTDYATVTVYDKDLGSDDVIGIATIKYKDGVFEEGKFNLSPNYGSFNIGDPQEEIELESYCSGLPKTDRNMEVFYKVFYGDRELYKSEIGKGEREPVFLPAKFKYPQGADKLKVVIYEKESVGSDDCLGTVEILINRQTIETGEFEKKDLGYALDATLRLRICVRHRNFGDFGKFSKE